MPTVIKYGISLRFIFFTSLRKKGKKAKPAIPILQPNTCIGEKATRLFLIRIKELPQIKLSIASSKMLSTAGEINGFLSATLSINA